jgi:hypothetical protein
MRAGHRRAHRWIWPLLALLLPAILALSFALRQDRLEDPPPQRLSAAGPPE